MISMPTRIEEGGGSSFLWLAPFAPPQGWRSVPRGGMCLCAFLFVISGKKILLGRYADHPAWEQLCGMDNKRVITNACGWTIPSSRGSTGHLAANRRRDPDTRNRPHLFRTLCQNLLLRTGNCPGGRTLRCSVSIRGLPQGGHQSQQTSLV
jgi:hypothetical protein